MRSLSRWIMRCLRLHRFDGNPLRRRSDRIETLAVLMTLLIFIAGLWPTVALGRQTYANGIQAELTDPAHQQAVVAEVVDKPHAPWRDAGNWTRTVRWTTPEGSLRTGQVILPTGTPVGSQIKIWIDGAGRPAGSPQSHQKTIVVTASTVIVAVVWAVMILSLCLAGVRVLLNRRRDAEWEREWMLADQRWRRPRQS
jgi:hypothetical protein